MNPTDKTPKMQRRHFERIAKIINVFDLGTISQRMLAEHFADHLAEFNSCFQRDKFINACLTGDMGKYRSRKRSGA